MKRIKSWNNKSNPHLISAGENLGIVEHDSKYLLFNFNSKKYKVLLKVFPLDILQEKYKLHYTVNCLFFLETIVQEYISVYLSGSFTENEQSPHSRKDIDLLLILEDEYEVELLKQKIKNLAL